MIVFFSFILAFSPVKVNVCISSVSSIVLCARPHGQTHKMSLPGAHYLFSLLKTALKCTHHFYLACYLGTEGKNWLQIFIETMPLRDL